MLDVQVSQRMHTGRRSHHGEERAMGREMAIKPHPEGKKPATPKVHTGVAPFAPDDNVAGYRLHSPPPIPAVESDRVRSRNDGKLPGGGESKTVAAPDATHC